MSNTPSDAELVAVMRDGYNCRYNDEQDHIDFARAVLAKWGTPQPVVREPLSDAQIKELIEDGVFLGNCKEIVRAIELAHGIRQKGGSNAE